MTNLEVLQRVVNGVFGDRNPVEEVADGVFSMDGGKFVIDNVEVTPVEVDRPGLKGVGKVVAYSVDVGYPPSGDVVELGIFPTIEEAAVVVVKAMAEQRARMDLENMGYEFLAADYNAERAVLEAAEREGFEAFGTHNLEANPYPHGIEHYKRWVKGWQRAHGGKFPG